MACQIQTDKYTDVVLDLIKLDQNLYNNFDNVAAFLLKSALAPEQKMMALYNIAHIYTRMAEMDPEYFKPGKAMDIVNASALENAQSFVQAAEEMYGVTKSAPLRVDTILKRIDALAGKTNINSSDFISPEGILPLITNYFNTTIFNSVEDRTTMLNEIAGALRTVIAERKDNGDHKKYLTGLVDDTIKELTRSSDFIPLTDVAELASLNNVLVILKSGQMVEAISENGKLYTVNPDRTLQEIPADQIEVAKDARLSDRSISNAGEHVFYADTIASNFRIKALNPEENETVIQKLNAMPSPLSAVRIHAVKISDIGDRRVERMKAVAANNPALGKLANREHETFENATQVAKLKSAPDAKILTLSRPKASEQGFVLVGEIIGSGERFYLYSNDNFAFVNANNTTERVDFTNPAHLEEVKKLSIKKSMDLPMSLNDKDLQKLSAAAEVYNEFKDVVTPMLEAKFAEGQTSVDVTKDFFNMYDMNQSKADRAWTRLSENIDKDPTLSVEVTIYNSETKTKEQRRIPFVYYLNGDPKLNPFLLVNVLKAEESIEVTRPNGEVVRVDMQTYASEMYGLNSERVKSLLSKNDPSQRNVLIKFRPDGSLTYRIANNVRQLDQVEEFASFIISVENMLNARMATAARSTDTPIRNLYKQFSFRHESAADGSKPLFVNFTTGYNGELQVVIKPSVSTNDYGFIVDKPQGYTGTKRYPNLSQFTFNINEQRIIDVAKALRGLSPKSKVQAVRKAIPALATFDLNNPDELFEFYRAVNNMSKGATPPAEIQELVKGIKEAHAMFAKGLVEDVVEKFEGKTAMFPQFMQLLQRDFTFKGVFKPELLVSRETEEGNLTANIIYSQNYTPVTGSANAKERFTTNLDNWTVLSSGPKRLAIVPRTVPLSPDLPVPAPAAAVPGVKPQHEIKTTSTPTDITDDIPEIDVYSVSDGSIDTETDAERLTSAEWLSQTLPQFELSKEDVSDVIDLTKINGVVLGRFKDKVIHLNNRVKSKGVIYHEAFHGVFRYLMTSPERERLINTVKANKAHASKFTEAALKEFASKRNYVYNKERMEQLQAEEILADGFQNYMNKKGAPAKGIIGKFMEMLKRLIEFFIKHGDYIDNAYSRIRRGGYTSTVANSGMFDTETVFEIRGLKEIVNHPELGTIKRNTVLSVEEQKQLVMMMTKYFITDNRKGETFEQKFDRIAKTVMEHEYNLDKMLASYPEELHTVIMRDYAERIRQYRFVLGARMLGEDLPDLNKTDKGEFNGKKYPSVIKIAGVERDNTNGEVSKEELMKLVKTSVESVINILDGKEAPDSEEDIDKPEITEFDEEGNPIVNQNNEDGGNDGETEEGREDFESGLNQHSRLESLSKEIRHFLALVRYDRKDRNGISFPRHIDGQQIFNLLLKTTSDVDVDMIVPHILNTSEKMREDGFTDVADDLRAVYNALDQHTGMSSNGGVPMRNLQLYNMILDVLDGTELDYLQTKVKTRQLTDPEGGVLGVETYDYTIQDKVMSTDVDARKKRIVSSMITTHAERGNDEAFRNAALELANLSLTISNNTTGLILSINETQGKKLQELTDKLHSLMGEVGIRVPKSLIRLSILAIDRRENMVTHNDAEIDPAINQDYEANSKLIGETKYLEKEFFRSLNTILKFMLKSTHDDYARLLDFDNSKDDAINRFNSILSKASAYIVKYDPTELQSTIRNAEGKPIYRYVKNTPALTTAQSIRINGLVKTLEKDPYFSRQLENWFKDNPAMGDIMNGNDTETARKVSLMLKNFRVALYGGVSQTFNKTIREGKSFKNIDEKSLYILHLTSFLNRTTLSEKVKDKDGNEKTVSIETYMRSFSQLEASQTNFMFSGLYEQYADQNGSVLNANKRLKFVDTLESVVRQEYNRIQREFKNFEENKRLYAAGTNNFILNYNATKDANGNITNVTPKGKYLRAYQFNKLSDFFKQNSDLYSNADDTGLMNFAKEGLSFEDIPADVRNMLLDRLNDFAKQSLQMHLKELVTAGVLTKNEINRKVQKAKVGPDGKPERDLDGKIIYEYVDVLDSSGNPVVGAVRYTSSVIAPLLKKDNQKPENVLDKYKKVGAGLIDAFGRKLNASTSLEGLIEDAYFNHWANSLLFNDIMDGDVAMNVKDATDYFKRHKKQLAAGSNLKRGTHRVAYIDTLKGYIHEKYLEYGPFYTKEQMEEFFANNPQISEEVKIEMRNDYGNKDMMRDVFDGQSVSLLLHQIDMHETVGRLKPEILDLLIAKHYRKLTKDEVKLMQNNKVVNNPKKTVTAARNSYHKLSENYIDRNDVSYLIIPAELKSIKNNFERSEAIRNYKKSAYDAIHGLYLEIYALRKQAQDAAIASEDTSEFLPMIQSKVEQIHSYYAPMKHRKELHDMLNAMEYHQIDQIMDTTASKNATLLPVDFFAESQRISGSKQYVNLKLSSLDVDNKFKYIQVETSGVKDKAKFSVQSKALLPADIRTLEQIVKASGKELTASESTALSKLTEALIDYQGTLKKTAESNLANLKTILRKDGDFEIGKVFNMIRESLLEQNAPSTTLKLFEIGPDGQPVHSPNLPNLRKMLEYYFFSQYSKHVTDEKGSGFKNIHISSFGYDVLVDEEGKIIPTEKYRANPDRYANATRRPLGVDKQVNADGTTTYFVECIMPMPYFRNEAHRNLYMNKLTKMFGVRIPTEDKRSMVALKVVDFMDSSNLNGVIVPHFIHLLSGSDFDVDSLYGQTYAHYFGFDGNPVVYGDYTGYSSEAQGRFIEFFNYMSDDKDMKPAIKNAENAIKAEGGFTPSVNTLEILYASGFDESDYEANINLAELTEEYQMTYEGIVEAKAERAPEKKAYLEALKRTEENPEDEEAWDERKRLGRIIGELRDEIDELSEEANIYKDKVARGTRFALAALRVEAILRAFEKYNLPVNQEVFASNPAYAMSVRPIFQNQNLTAKLNLLSNEAVYKHLYIDERSSTARFEQVGERFGNKVEEYESPFNQYSIDGIIKIKVNTSFFKDAIGFAANINKFAALASENGLELNGNNVVWKYVTVEKDAEGNNVYKGKAYNKFGAINDEADRVVALIGNMLGMFADGAKKPIPAALFMNDVNTPVSLAMIAAGLQPEFAMAFNFIKEIRNAVLEVQASESAITERVSTPFNFISNKLNDQVKALANKNKNLVNNLKALRIITPKSSAFKMDIKSENLVIEFKPKVIDTNKLMTNEVSSQDTGFKLSALIRKGEIDPRTGVKAVDDTMIPLEEDEQTAILLTLYSKQAQQTFALRRAGSLLNMFKKLNPSFVTFDKLMNNIRTLKENTDDNIFTPESTERLFGENMVWPLMYEAMQDLDEQASKIFLERTSFFRPVKSLFEEVFTDHSEIAKIITSFVALHKYRTSYIGSRKTGVPVMDELLAKDDQNIIDTFTPEYSFTNTLEKELQEMQDKYPDNVFLGLLRSQNTDNYAMSTKGKLIREKVIKMINKGKISGSFANDVASAVQYLMIKENAFMNKLAHYEFAKTGLQYKSGSFLNLLDPDMLLPLSKFIKEFVAALSETKGNRYEIIKALQKYMGEGTSVEDVTKMLDEMFVIMANAASTEMGNTRIKTVGEFSFKDDSLYMQSFENTEKMTGDEKYLMARNTLFYVIGQSSSSDPKRKANKYKPVGRNGKDIVETVVLNMNVPKSTVLQATTETMVELGKKLNIRPVIGQKDKYIFPLMFKMGDETYLLQGIDDQMDNANFGETLLTSIVGKGGYERVGTIAKYKVIPKELTAGTLSPIGFSRAASEKYMSYVKRTSRIDDAIVPEQLERVSTKAIAAEEAVQPLEKSKVARTNTIITRAQLKSNPNVLFVFGDNNTRKGLGGQAKEMRGEPNAFGISTKKLPAATEDAYMTDTELDANKAVITADVDKAIAAWNTGKYTRLIIPQIGVGLAQLPTRAPQTYAHLQSELQRLEDTVMGKITVAPIVENTQVDEMAGTADSTSMLLSLFAEAEQSVQEPVVIIEPGQFVKFNGETFIVTKINANGTIQVYNPTLEGPASKKSVSPANVTPVAGKATVVDYKKTQYLVTPKNTIISMTSNKAMQWDENNGDRKAILEIANQVKQTEIDLKNLNITPAVVDVLYNQSSKRMTKDAFGKAAAEIIVNLRATTAPEQIIEKIKCL